MILASLAIALASPGYACTVAEVRNVSLREDRPAPVEPSFHPLGALTLTGTVYARTEQVETNDASAEVTHRIDRGTGAYEAVAIEVHHGAGEQYEIVATGTCRLIAR
jgi:hypothetical protein